MVCFNCKRFIDLTFDRHCNHAMTTNIYMKGRSVPCKLLRTFLTNFYFILIPIRVITVTAYYVTYVSMEMSLRQTFLICTTIQYLNVWPECALMVSHLSILCLIIANAMLYGLCLFRFFGLNFLLFLVINSRFLFHRLSSGFYYFHFCYCC